MSASFDDIKKYLKDNGLDITDEMLQNCLNELEQDGLIEEGEGEEK